MKKLDKIKILSLSAETKQEIIYAACFLEYCKNNCPNVLIEFESSSKNSQNLEERNDM